MLVQHSWSDITASLTRLRLLRLLAPAWLQDTRLPSLLAGRDTDCSSGLAGAGAWDVLQLLPDRSNTRLLPTTAASALLTTSPSSVVAAGAGRLGLEEIQ